MITRLFYQLIAIFPLAIALIMASCDKNPAGPEITTGNLIIISHPAGADITLNGKSLNLKTPDTLKNLEKGHYEIMLELEGYHPSIDTITVIAGQTKEYHSYLDRGYGSILFTSKPTGAIVSIDAQQIPDTTPVIKNGITTGPHLITISKTGYADWCDSVYVLIDDTLTVNVKLDTLLGWININSVPAGADIYINSSSKLLTAPVFDSLPPGSYLIRAELNGYYPLTKTITITVFDTVDVNFKMILITGSINITTNPEGAQIILDSLPTGKLSPDIIKTTPGSHQINLHKAGYYDADTTLLVTADSTLNLDINLEAKPTSMSISSNPPGAKISINGIYSEYFTPHTFSNISPNAYNVRLTLPGYFPADSSFEAVLGEDNYLNFSMTAIQLNARFAFTIGDTIFAAQLDGIITDTLALDYDDYISGYVSYYGRLRWSPDGKKIAYSGDTKAVSLISANGTWINGFNGNRSMDFAWSPSSDEIVYGYYCGGLYKNILTTNWYGAITSGCYDNSPAYSPDGSKIIFTYHNWGTKCRIDIVNSNGSSRKNIYGWFKTGFDEVVDMYWSSDSTAIFKISGRGIYQLLIPDSGSTVLTKPVSDGVKQLRMSADRQWTAFNTSSGLYLMSLEDWIPYRISTAAGYDFSVMSGGEYVACRRSDGVYFISRQGQSYHVINCPKAGRGAIDIKP